jgi:hypothetical protein
MITAALAAALGAACGAGDSAGPRPPAPGLSDPAGLASRLAAINHAVTVPPLQSLGAVAVALYLSGVDVNNLSGLDLNHTWVWDPQRQRYATSSRTDAPANSLRLVLYTIDVSSGLPAVPLVEIGAVDFYPQNAAIGGPFASTQMRYVVSGTGASATVYADFTARSNYQPTCLCATVAGWINDGVTRVDFSAPYTVILHGQTSFSATFTALPQNLQVLQSGSLPPLGDSLVGAGARFALLGDSLESQGRLSFHSAAPPTAAFSILVNGRAFATGSYGAGGESFTGSGGRTLTVLEQTALHELAALPLGLALNVEFPTLTTFFCGC